MGCKSCSSGGCGTKTADGTVSGCRNNGACGTGGCNKMNVFDWLSNMDLPLASRFNIVEVRFKGGRKEFFRNAENLELYAGDPVIVDVPNGHHMGYVSLQGELVRLQMIKKSVKETDEIRTIYRVASSKDLEKYEQVKLREMPTLFRTRQIADELKLNMKLSDVEYQADNTKATFYYSAEERVDFRELIKVLAGEFKIRVEMKQISLRQEAGRLGGIGSCGRELCCSTWLADFKSVSTAAARYQNLSLNPSKLSGQCGRLKCCLNYELDTYMEALKDIPTIEEPLLTEKGPVFLQKTDIFKKLLWFGYHNESTWIPLTVNRVNEILAMNKKGVKPVSLEENDGTPKKEVPVSAVSVVENDLERFDKKNIKSGKPKKKKKKKKPKTSPEAGKA
ncbi:Signal peptidase-like protein [Rhodocytophaga rosea]|uniref:Signal peptidase-like protein n=1 Tax=Rhodocytophaga rosea TaxID=2704465 RepID=A0A6C0GNG2_9BACT|nr:regulatory iron-sulfur-containing complex subunit RicT [Rhodocytophaga rosea]QHT69384.1 Signal peptidase-like protein [Rhodocytophaga rosea]